MCNKLVTTLVDEGVSILDRDDLFGVETDKGGISQFLRAFHRLQQIEVRIRFVQSRKDVERTLVGYLLDVQGISLQCGCVVLEPPKYDPSFACAPRRYQIVDSNVLYKRILYIIVHYSAYA